jgi:PAS domain S-box-containing protein
MSSSELLLEAAGPQGHIVQLYEADEQVLARNVTEYLWEGLKRGEGLLVIATPEHTQIFARQLKSKGADMQAAMRERRLVFLDAQETLARFMVDGQPDWRLFESTVGDAMQAVRGREGHAGLRAYGEMVGVLWKAEQFSPAILLEEFWNKLLQSGGFKLFCAYPIDVFGKEFHTAAVDALLCAHTHLVPAGNNGDLECALNRAMHEILGSAVEEPEVLAEPEDRVAWAVMPKAESSILSLRSKHPGRADEVLTRARQHYQNEKRFRALIENSSDAISLMDTQGNVLYASASSTRVLGYQPEELVGQNSFDLIDPDDLEQAHQAFEQVLANPSEPVLTQARLRRKDGRWCWAEIASANQLDQPDIRAIVSNCRDISAHKAAEQETQRHAEQLARSNAELQAFAYAATHDLQEPLRTVCAFTELLVKNAQLNEKGQEFAGYIVDGVKRMSALLDDLLSITRLTVSDARDEIELSRAAQQAIDNLAGAIEESGARITIDPLPAALGNEIHVVQLFQNLLANGIKYRREVPVEIHVTAAPLGREWVIKIQDNGIGIAPEYYDHVFGMFKRLHAREVPGTGIGLAICKKIVEGMGGRIWIESQPGVGSTFCFTTPKAAESTLKSVTYC